MVYPDEYLVEEDRLGFTEPQDWLLRYLITEFELLFHDEQWMITRNRNFYHEAIENSQKLIVPDLAIFKGIDIPPAEQSYIASWDMRTGNKPCPPLVIEASSPGTYSSDIDPDKKPRLYGLIGVKEYFAYDPNRPPAWPRRFGGTRLLGWRYNEQGQPTPIEPDENGWMWSEVLECWLKPDELYLQLYNRNKDLLLTKDQAEEKARKQVEVELAEVKRQLEELRRQQKIG